MYTIEDTVDFSYMYEAIIETKEIYNDLCMKMIRCEHNCIINENNDILIEAKEEFIEKSKQIVKNLVIKFRTFCSNLYDTFLSIMAKTAKVLSFTKAENVIGKKVKITNNMKEFVNLLNRATKILNNATNGNFGNYESLDDFSRIVEGEEEITLQKSDFVDAVNYINNFKPAIKILNKLRSNQYNEYIKKDYQIDGWFHLYD